MAGSVKLYNAFVFIACGGLLFGYIIGVTSNIVTKGQLECADDWTGAIGTWKSVSYRQCYQLSALDKGFLTSLNLIGALMSSLFCFVYSENMGRKLEVQIGAALFFAGSAIAAASPVKWAIYTGFTVYGLGIGFGMHAAPVYIAEIAPADIRGALVSAKEAVVVTGIFLGFLFGLIFSGVDTVGWRYMVMLSSAVAVVMEIGITFVPESPRFLVLKAVRGGGLLGANDASMGKALDALRYFRTGAPDSDVNVELEAMRIDIAAAVCTQTASVMEAFRYPIPLVIGCGLVFLQQITGQPSVLYYATNIFKDAGLGDSAALSATGVGLVKLIATLLTVWRVDAFGRRPLLFVGITMMVVALSVISVAFLFRVCTTPGKTIDQCDAAHVVLPQAWAIATVIALMVYVSGYQVGFGPIAWLMISEVFPVGVRGAALSIAAVVNFSSNIGVTLTQGLLLQLLTPAGLFLAYLIMSALSIVFVKLVVPETKGKTLEEIEIMLSSWKSSRDVRTTPHPP